MANPVSALGTLAAAGGSAPTASVYPAGRAVVYDLSRPAVQAPECIAIAGLSGMTWVLGACTKCGFFDVPISCFIDNHY